MSKRFCTAPSHLIGASKAPMQCNMWISLPIWQQIRGFAAAAKPRPSTRFGKNISLDHFLQRGKVISLWRDILRGTRRISDEANRKEMRGFAKAEFERNKEVTDITQIRYLVSTGKTQWEQMERFIDGL